MPVTPIMTIVFDAMVTNFTAQDLYVVAVAGSEADLAFIPCLNTCENGSATPGTTELRADKWNSMFKMP